MTTAALIYNHTQGTLVCQGKWCLTEYQQLLTEIDGLTFKNQHHLTVDAQAIQALDSAGVMLLLKLQETIERYGASVTLKNLTEPHKKLLDLVKNKSANIETIDEPQLSFLANLGKSTLEQLQGLNHYLQFIGKLTAECIYLMFNPRRIRWGAFINTIFRTGFQALPIIALLSLMIGVVITYQMGLQLKSYGANIFIVDLLGIAVLREFAPLLTAIMVAGRTGSAFTAQLGIMKINQEIDALDTMGITSAELLLLPRIFGLCIALPLLTIWADIFGVVGGAFMANNMLGISWYDFFLRFPHVIKLKTLLIGVGKAPIFALLIASIGCYQGMKVGFSADSVGLKTTRSVVLAIFFIIVADALFSIVFSKLKI